MHGPHSTHTPPARDTLPMMRRTHAISSSDATRTRCGRQVASVTTGEGFDCQKCLGNGAPPLKLTEEVSAAIQEHRREGIPWKYIAWGVGISEETLHEWRRRGKADEEAGRDTPHARLSESLRASEAHLVRELVVRASDGGKGSSGAQWMLERRYREEFGRKSEHRHTNKSGDGPVAVEVTSVPWEAVKDMSPEQLAAAGDDDEEADD